MPAAFVYEIPVRFGDVDRAGIVYYPRFLHYFHVAFEEFFKTALGKPYPEMVDRDRLGMPTVHVDVDFASPLAYGDSALVEVRVRSVGRTSIEWDYEVRSGLSGALSARGRTVTAAVDMETFRPTPVPEPLRSKLLARVPGPPGAS